MDNEPTQCDAVQLTHEKYPSVELQEPRVYDFAPTQPIEGLAHQYSLLEGDDDNKNNNNNNNDQVPDSRGGHIELTIDENNNDTDLDIDKSTRLEEPAGKFFDQSGLGSDSPHAVGRSQSEPLMATQKAAFSQLLPTQPFDDDDVSFLPGSAARGTQKAPFSQLMSTQASLQDENTERRSKSLDSLDRPLTEDNVAFTQKAAFSQLVHTQLASTDLQDKPSEPDSKPLRSLVTSQKAFSSSHLLPSQLPLSQQDASQDLLSPQIQSRSKVSRHIIHSTPSRDVLEPRLLFSPWQDLPKNDRQDDGPVGPNSDPFMEDDVDRIPDTPEESHHNIDSIDNIENHDPDVKKIISGTDPSSNGLASDGSRAASGGDLDHKEIRDSLLQLQIEDDDVVIPETQLSENISNGNKKRRLVVDSDDEEEKPADQGLKRQHVTKGISPDPTSQNDDSGLMKGTIEEGNGAQLGLPSEEKLPPLQRDEEKQNLQSSAQEPLTFIKENGAWIKYSSKWYAVRVQGVNNVTSLLASSPRTIVTVIYNTDEISETAARYLHLLDIRVGDKVKVVQSNPRCSYVVEQLLSCSAELKDMETGLIACNGYDKVIVRNLSNPGEVRTVSLDNLMLTVAQAKENEIAARTAKRKEEWSNGKIKQGYSASQRKISESMGLRKGNTTSVNLLAGKGNNDNNDDEDDDDNDADYTYDGHTDVNGNAGNIINSLRAQQSKSVVPTDDIFEGCVFTLSKLDERELSETDRAIWKNGGIVLPGFDELFNIDFDKLHLTWNSGRNLDNDTLKFAAVISKEPQRTRKYLEALALGWPCLSYKYIKDCVKERRFLRNWDKYVLAAGQSEELGGTYCSYTDVYEFRKNWMSGNFTLKNQFYSRTSPLDMPVYIVGSLRNADASEQERMLVYLLLALCSDKQPPRWIKGAMTNITNNALILDLASSKERLIQTIINRRLITE